MKLLFAGFAALLLTISTGYSAPGADAPQYPSWLEMKPGYAEACIDGGGCVPMTQAELQGLAAEVARRALQSCRQGTSI